MSTPPVREQFLVISALGRDAMALTNLLSRTSHENRCAVIMTLPRLARRRRSCALRATLRIANRLCTC